MNKLISVLITYTAFDKALTYTPPLIPSMPEVFHKGNWATFPISQKLHTRVFWLVYFNVSQSKFDVSIHQKWLSRVILMDINTIIIMGDSFIVSRNKYCLREAILMASNNVCLGP